MPNLEEQLKSDIAEFAAMLTHIAGDLTATPYPPSIELLKRMMAEVAAAVSMRCGYLCAAHGFSMDELGKLASDIAAVELAAVQAQAMARGDIVAGPTTKQ